MNEWDGSADSDRDALAPVIPLFAERMPRPAGAASAQAMAPNHPAFAHGPRSASDDDRPRAVPSRARSTVRFMELDDEASAEPIDPTEPNDPLEPVEPVESIDATEPNDATAPDAGAHVEFAEKALLRKLRTRSLSVREARGVLAGFELSGNDVADVIGRFEANGYLDDTALAEQLVHSGSTRKGQGRHAIAQAMSGRGIPREVAEVALAELPDDDLERALDYARSKAVAMARLDPQAALRRLVGQLTRRGYPSHIAMTAARQALDEQTRPRGPFFS